MAKKTRSRGPLGLIRTLNYMAFLPLAARAPTYGRLVLALLGDDRIPWSRKAVLGIAAGYLASPLDVIPESIPLIGAIDDVAVVVLALDIFLEGIPRDLLDEKLDELGIERRDLDGDLERVRRVVPRSVRRVALRLPDALAGAGSLIRRSGIDRRLRSWISEGQPA
jgi:uncharacterized membrane protein YkvA (DUF1232 family)